MEFVEHALQYAEKGFSVFALPVNGKVPRKDTNGFKDATRSQEQIEEWWSENAHYNIGIKCGNFKGRCLVVIDIDKHGNDGYKGLSELEDLLGELPDTVTALTPTGGRHFYFLSAKALKNSAKFQGKDGVDVRAEGGYVVAPPSIHPDTKTPYRWENGKSPFEIPFAMLPNSWERAMEKNVPKDEKRTIEDVKFTKGNRVDSLVSLIGSLVRKGLNELEIRAAVDVANSMRCLPPLSPSEMETNVYPALTRNWLKEDPFWENIKVKSSYNALCLFLIYDTFSFQFKTLFETRDLTPTSSRQTTSGSSTQWNSATCAKRMQSSYSCQKVKRSSKFPTFSSKARGKNKHDVDVT